MLTVNINIRKDTASPALRDLRRGMGPENILPVLGRSVTNAVRDHFDELESTRPNKLKGKRAHYYSGARSGTSFVVEADRAIVGVQQRGIRMRYYGGAVQAGVNPSFITGKPTRYLTIPVTAESYGHRAADFPDLVVLWGRNGPYALARVTEGTIAKGAHSDTDNTEILFILKSQVDIPEDHTMLPPGEQLTEYVKADFHRYVDMIWRRAARGLGEQP